MSELEQYLVPIRRYSANPCMDCCPISQCPWLREEKPVPGWTAKKRTFVVGRLHTPSRAAQILNKTIGGNVLKAGHLQTWRNAYGIYFIPVLRKR